MKQFKTESKRILDLMINSIYTNKEIFLRELISNASDAIDKLHFKSLTDSKIDSDFTIFVAQDKKNRTLTISDNGIGMTAEELEHNLGTIAQSGTLDFKKTQEENELIGQFGVGFYSAFMVGKKLEVISKAYGSDEAFKWTSEGAQGYTIEKADKEKYGTDIIIYLKDNDEDNKYDEYLEEYFLSNLIKKYSDYIRYPIKMEMTRSRKKEGCPEDKPEWEDYKQIEVINSQIPIWKKDKKDIKAEDYEEFYKNKFHDYEKPLKVIHAKIEGNINYTMLLFVPARAPYDYYSKEYQKGIQLYTNGVLIMDKCSDIIPDHFGFIRGIVDSSDLSLNISREMLQQDRQLQAIANSLEKRIIKELKGMIKDDRENYEKLFSQFGLSIKFGVYQNFGVKKEELKDLMMFHSSTEKKLVTLEDYVSRMKEKQDTIYYACGESVDKIDKMPQTELVKDKGFEILYLTDNVDEFALKMLDKYQEKSFKSVAAKDLGLETEQEKEEVKKKSEEHKDMFKFMTEALDGKVKDVRLSSRMKNHAVCLGYDGEISLEMEKTFKAMPNKQEGMEVEAEKILEINPTHPILTKLVDLFDKDKDTLKDYTKVLFNEAMLMEGFGVEDANDFASTLTKLLSK